jgi:hypothetical protein
MQIRVELYREYYFLIKNLYFGNKDYYEMEQFSEFHPVLSPSSRV